MQTNTLDSGEKQKKKDIRDQQGGALKGTW